MKRGKDAGCFYHEGFLRGDIDCQLEPGAASAHGGKEDEGKEVGAPAATNSSKAKSAQGDSSSSTSEVNNDNSNQEEGAQLSQFLAFAGPSDPTIARQYLEMSGGDLEMAVSLFLEHGGGGDGGLGLLGVESAAGAAACGGGGGEVDDPMEGDTEPASSFKQQQEPDFYSLPFMPSLPVVKKPPPPLKPAGKIVISALKEYGAYRTLRRALLRWIHVRRSRASSLQLSLSNQPRLMTSTTTNNCNLQHGTSHFLFQSLLHPSLLVRRAAGRMLLHNIHRVHEYESSSGAQVENSNGQKDLHRLQEALVILTHNLMFGEAPYQQHKQHSLALGHSTNNLAQHQQQEQQMQIPSHFEQPIPFNNAIHHQAEGGDPAVQLMGMLLSLVCDGGFSNVLVSEEVKSIQAGRNRGFGLNDTILSEALIQELASSSIESFVASGGLRWACGSIVRLVQMLANGSSSGSVSGSGDEGSGSDGEAHRCHHCLRRQLIGERKDGITSQTIQSRLVLLIDLVYRLVLFGSIPAAVDRKSFLVATTSNGDEGGDDDKAAASQSSSIDDAKDKKKKKSGSGPSAGAASPSGESSRTTSLRQSLRSAIAGMSAPPFSSSSGTRGREKKSGISSSSSNNNSGVPSSSSGNGGDGSPPSSNATEEDRARKERRKSTLERVQRIFWATTLSSAVCHPMSASGAVSHLQGEGGYANNEGDYQGSFTPLACLVAAYQILRGPTVPRGSFDEATTKAIAVLGRLIDPAAGSVLVETDPDIPWGVSSLLGDMDAKVDKAVKPSSRSARKRARSSSHASQGSNLSSSPRRLPHDSSSRIAGVSGLEAGDDADGSAHRPKRTRTAGGPGSVSSLLERLTSVDSAAADIRQRLADPSSLAASLTGGGGAGDSLFAQRYRSAMESMLRGSTSAGSASRDGTLSRLLSSGVARASASGDALRNTIRARAIVDGQPPEERNEWRLLGEEDIDPEGMIDDEDEGTEFDEEGENDEDGEVDGESCVVWRKTFVSCNILSSLLRSLSLLQMMKSSSRNLMAREMKVTKETRVMVSRFYFTVIHCSK